MWLRGLWTVMFTYLLQMDHPCSLPPPQVLAPVTERHLASIFQQAAPSQRFKVISAVSLR